MADVALFHQRQAAQVRDMLDRIRAMRDACPSGELRRAFNEAADGLDVLESKLTHGADAMGDPVFVTNPAEGISP